MFEFNTNTPLAKLPDIILASALCSATIIDFTTPQVVRLSQTSASPLSAFPMSLRASVVLKNIAPQTAITAVQFCLVRKLIDVVDQTLGPSPYNIPLAYGIASVPLIAAKYNLIQESVYLHGSRVNAAAPSTIMTTKKTMPNPNPMTMEKEKNILATTRKFWIQKIQPGLLWSYLRDSGSIGGGIILSPVVTSMGATMFHVEKIESQHRIVGQLKKKKYF